MHRKNVVNPFEEVINDNNINNKNLSLYSLGANDYQVYDKNSGLIYLTNNETLSVNKFNEYKAKLKNDTINQLHMSRSSYSDSIVYSSLDGYTVISDGWTGSLIKNDSITYAYHPKYYCSKDVSQINA